MPRGIYVRKNRKIAGRSSVPALLINQAQKLEKRLLSVDDSILSGIMDKLWFRLSHKEKMAALKAVKLSFPQ